MLSRPHAYKVTIHLVDKIAGYLINIALESFAANLDEDLNMAILQRRNEVRLRHDRHQVLWFLHEDQVGHPPTKFIEPRPSPPPTILRTFRHARSLPSLRRLINPSTDADQGVLDHRTHTTGEASPVSPPTSNGELPAIRSEMTHQ